MVKLKPRAKGKRSRLVSAINQAMNSSVSTQRALKEIKKAVKVSRLGVQKKCNKVGPS